MRIILGIAALGASGGLLLMAIHAGASSTPSAGALVALVVLATLVSWIGFARSRGDELAQPLARLEARIDAAARQRLDMRMRAETAGRFREEFVAAVRHELKTPLNAILGFTQVLLDEIDGPLTPQQREDVAAIRQAGSYLSELVDAVLEEWVPDRATPLPFAPVDLAALVREAARLLEGQAVTKTGVRVVVEVAPDLPRPLGDARRLRQVLINLGTNALRATMRGAVTITAAPDPEGVRITVRDTGSGIPKELMPKLFEEFSQVGTTSSQVGGSGLGLALTRDLVEWHDGRIEVDSIRGEGSTFSVVLPLEPE